MNELQDKILEIMIEIDRISRLEGINYALFYGTAIGAIRHEGFIPWDDDCDIMIKREDRDRFFKALETHLDPKKYFVLKTYSLDWNKAIYKVMMKGTTLIEHSSRHTRRPKGIFVDVFIAEKYPERRFRKILYDFIMKRTLNARSLGDRYLGNSRKYWIVRFTNGLIHIGDWFLDRIPEKNTRSRHVRKASVWDDILDVDYLNEVIDIRFEGCQFMVSRDYDRLLKQQFGDYMTPPPECDRVGHHTYEYSIDMGWEEWVDSKKE